MKKICALIAATIVFAGCVLPQAGYYYRPSSPQGESGAFGVTVPDKLKLDRNGVVILIALREDSNKQIAAYVEVSASEFVTMRIAWEQLRIFDAKGGVLPVESIESFGERRCPKYGDLTRCLGILKKIEFSDELPLRDNLGVLRVFHLVTAGPPKNVVLTLPEMLVGDQVFPAVNIGFNRIAGAWLQGLN